MGSNVLKISTDPASHNCNGNFKGWEQCLQKIERIICSNNINQFCINSLTQTCMFLLFHYFCLLLINFNLLCVTEMWASLLWGNFFFLFLFFTAETHSCKLCHDSDGQVSGVESSWAWKEKLLRRWGRRGNEAAFQQWFMKCLSFSLYFCD